MAKYRVSFRGTGQSNLIEAASFTEKEQSYVFFNEDGDIVAFVPRDATLLIRKTEEE